MIKYLQLQPVISEQLNSLHNRQAQWDQWLREGLGFAFPQDEKRSKKSRQKSNDELYSARSLDLHVHEDDNAFMLTADAPGVVAADIDMQIIDNILHIKAKRSIVAKKNKQTNKEHKQQGHNALDVVAKKDIPTQYNYRAQVRVAQGVEQQGISAHIQHGVLTITLPKVAAPQPQKIAVTDG